MKINLRIYHRVFRWFLALIFLALLIIYIFLGMMSVTSGIGQTVGPGSNPNQPLFFDLEGAASLGLN